MKNKSKKDSITINKKVMFGLAPVIAIIAVLLSKNKVGPMFLFLVGIAYGIYLGINFIKGQK